jgi:hypothetical protein
VNNRQISYEEGEKYKNSKSDIEMFIETSAKTGHNVEYAFTTAAKILYLKHRDKIKKARTVIAEKAQRRRLQRMQQRKQQN